MNKLPHTAEHYTALHERGKHQIDLPVFDILSYNKILTRIGRQKKLLERKELESKRFDSIHASLHRSLALRNRHVNRYLTDLAIFIVHHRHNSSLHDMVQMNHVSKEVKPIVLEHWNGFQQKLTKARKLYG